MFGDRLRRIRKTLGLSQKKFGDCLGISQKHVSQIEKETREPSEQLIKHLCLHYFTSENWLKTGEGEMFISPQDALKSVKERFGEHVFQKVIIEMFYDKDIDYILNPPVSGDDGKTPTTATVAERHTDPQADQLSTLEKHLESMMAGFGKPAIIEACASLIKKHSLILPNGRPGNHHPNPGADFGDPELNRLISIIRDLWITADDDMKGWIKVQLRRAFPDDVVEEAQKKRKETQGQAS